jgi:RNA polymerase sigma factor (sigma-70 family)
VTDDRFLVRAFLNGDEPAFRELYRRFTPALYRIVWRLTGGRDEDAADIMQEVWLRASRRLATFRWEAALSTWLTSIAINCVREHSRRARDAAMPLSGEIGTSKSQLFRARRALRAALTPSGGARLQAGPNQDRLR